MVYDWVRNWLVWVGENLIFDGWLVVWFGCWEVDSDTLARVDLFDELVQGHFTRDVHFDVVRFDFSDLSSCFEISYWRLMASAHCRPAISGFT